MWLLSCDGDLLGGKRVWLRPGSAHLFGRTTGRTLGGEQLRYIEHKSVSRKHLVIHVGPTQPADAVQLHARTEIRLEDSSKSGTTLDGEKFSQASKTLTGREHTFRLGSHGVQFRLEWRPVVISHTKSTKSARAKNDRLLGTDVKLVQEFVMNETTHLVAKKRNTPAALQALLQARWLVTDAFLDALAAAAQKSGVDANGDALESLLEQDFDANWPREEEYLVPAGPEPVARPNELLKPRPERAEVFRDYTFVFLARNQCDNLMPVITAGGGKALCWEVRIGQSTVDDLVVYVKEVVGEKGDGSFKLSQLTGQGGVVLIQLGEREREENKEWVDEFHHNMCLALDQMAIAQNEFLDAILTVDASGLKRQLRAAESPELDRNMQGSASPPQTSLHPEGSAAPSTDGHLPTGPPATQDAQQATHQQEAEASALLPTGTKKRTRRVITQSLFRGFDDLEPSQITKSVSNLPEPPLNTGEPSPAMSVQNLVADESARTVDTRPGPHGNRKRLAPVEDEPEDNMFDDMLQGQAAMKRRRLEALESGERPSISKTAAEKNPISTGKHAQSKRKAEKSVDIVAEMQARREREDEERERDDAALRNALDGIDIGDLKDLAKIEVMELPARDRSTRTTHQNGRGNRWNPAWDGRQNFKKFRRQGQRRDAPRPQRVMVTLEEVPRKGHGIGDEYWLEPPPPQSGRGKSKTQVRSQPLHHNTIPSSDDTTEATTLRRHVQSSHEQDAQHAEEEQLFVEEIAGTPRDEALAMNATPSQTMRTDTQRKATGKRPAVEQSGGPSKRSRLSQSWQGSNTRDNSTLDDDDDDGLKFRRRRR